MAWIEGWDTTVARGDDGEEREREREAILETCCYKGKE